MKISLRPREPPLAPAGVAAVGDGVSALAAATLRRIDGGAELHAATGGGWLVVLGEEADLPWADGCVYVGREGRLLIPTTSAIAPHPELVAAALSDGGLLVVLEDVVLRGPLPHGPVDRDRLAACT